MSGGVRWMNEFSVAPLAAYTNRLECFSGRALHSDVPAEAHMYEWDVV